MIGLQTPAYLRSAMKPHRFALATLVVIMSLVTHARLTNADELEIIGYVETLRLERYNLSLPAKIDTGALTSSLHAPDYEVFKKNGKKWVRFTLKTKKGRRVEIKRPVERFVRIRRASVDVKRRPIIKLKSCVGGKTKKAEFSLTDRSSMNYQAIIGRAFLSDKFVVNSASSFLATRRCDRSKK